MIIKRNKNDRGVTHLDWLRSKHSFSFGGYYDPEQMGFNVLRVINEDRVIPSAGFGTHPHDNMEIISYVLEGELAHKDSMGNGSIIKPGDIQLMSAGSGVTHSEYNASNSEEVHFLQIWIIPNVEDQSPGYQQQSFNPEEMHNKFRVVISPDGVNQSLRIKQDVYMLAGKFDEGQKTVFETKPNRQYWLQIVRGEVEINGEKTTAGDGFAISDESKIEITMLSKSEILLFELLQI